jgi:hypothetical protein
MSTCHSRIYNLLADDLNGVVVMLAMLTDNPKVPGSNSGSWSFSEGYPCNIFF